MVNYIEDGEGSYNKATRKYEIKDDDYEIAIDFGARYLTYDMNGKLGNFSIYDHSNKESDGGQWPFGHPDEPMTNTEFHSTGKENRLVCISWASGRFWEMNFPNEEFGDVFGNTWGERIKNRYDDDANVINQRLLDDNKIDNSKMFITEPDLPIENSIILTGSKADGHAMFIEKIIYKDDKKEDIDYIVITESNNNSGNQYGFNKIELDYEDYKKYCDTNKFKCLIAPSSKIN